MIHLLNPAIAQQLDALGPLRLALEWRAGAELAALFALWPWLIQLPQGDGHAVLVLPRFLGCDLSTEPLRLFLNRLGYRAGPWGLGINLGPRPGLLEACLERLDQLYVQTGRKVSLIGWSLGGLYARELAKARPAQVRLVITLGAPIAAQFGPFGWHQLQSRQPQVALGHSQGYGPIAEPPPVPTTAILSRSDGIVPWFANRERPGPRTENILVDSSHLGLAFNPWCLYAIADRLSQPEDDWRPFARGGWRAWLYS